MCIGQETTATIPADTTGNVKGRSGECDIIGNASDQAIKPMPVWGSVHPETRPMIRDRQLAFQKTLLTLRPHWSGSGYSAAVCIIRSVTASDVRDAQRLAVPAIIAALEEAAAELRAFEAASESEVTS